MKDIVLEIFADQYLEKYIKWLNKDYIKKWFGNPEDWIHEIKNKNNEFKFIKHYVVKVENNEIGFYQYYDCYYTQEEWYKIDEVNKIYSIDYLIGEEIYLNMDYGKMIVEKLIEKIKEINGKTIIVQPELENKASTGVLLANGFIYDKEKVYFYKNL